jgi:hypothetical protein
MEQRACGRRFCRRLNREVDGGFAVNKALFQVVPATLLAPDKMALATAFRADFNVVLVVPKWV